MSVVNQNDLEPLKKKSKRDGLRVCVHCGSSSGVRCLVCTNKNCNKPFPKKDKNWRDIESHARKMTSTYIKEKLFNRMDQLSTKPGWTGILFLVNDQNDGNSSGKRVYTHTYATKGSGAKLAKAIGYEILTKMKKFLHAEYMERSSESSSLASPANCSGSVTDVSRSNLNDTEFESLSEDITIPLAAVPATEMFSPAISNTLTDLSSNACSITLAVPQTTASVSSASTLSTSFQGSSSRLTSNLSPDLSSNTCSITLTVPQTTASVSSASTLSTSFQGSFSRLTSNLSPDLSSNTCSITSTVPQTTASVFSGTTTTTSSVSSASTPFPSVLSSN